MGFEESVENLNLVKEFCDKFISSKPFCFNFEDFLYSPMSMKNNKLAFIAELFYSFEVQPINLVKSNHFDLFKDYIKSILKFLDLEMKWLVKSWFYLFSIKKKEYTKRHFHATTPFLSARISDVTRKSFIRGGTYTPPHMSTTMPNLDTQDLKKLVICLAFYLNGSLFFFLVTYFVYARCKLWTSCNKVFF